MFYDIVSNLSLSPAATSQLAFYMRRLRGESVTRKLSLVMAGLLVVVQFASIGAPPTSANQASPNDIIYGGINDGSFKADLKDLLQVYDQNRDQKDHHGYKELFDHFSITRDELVHTHLATINSSNHDLHSVGRDPHSSLDHEFAVGDHHYFIRPLYTWGDGIPYQVLQGQRADGSFFAVMLGCGNIVVKKTGIPSDIQTQVGNPNLTIEKKATSDSPLVGQTVPPGTTITYELTAKNTGNAPAKNVVMGDRLPDDVTYIKQSSLSTDKASGHISAFHGHSNGVAGLNPGYYVYWKIPELKAGGHATGRITVKINDNVDNRQVCNSGFTKDSQQDTTKSNDICYPVKKNTPKPPPGGGGGGGPKPGSPNIVLAKTAVLVTAGGQRNANNATAQPGDTVEYTLTTTNTGTAIAKNYVVTEHVDDILEYADVVDPRGGTLKDGILTWPKTNIAAGGTYIASFVVKIKNPIPTKPASSSDPQSFDLHMDNVYGNFIRVNVPTPPEKQVEVAAATLPQTGAGTSTLIVLLLLAVISFFYFRNRQLITEIAILRGDHQGGV